MKACHNDPNHHRNCAQLRRIDTLLEKAGRKVTAER